MNYQCPFCFSKLGDSYINICKTCVMFRNYPKFSINEFVIFIVINHNNINYEIRYFLNEKFIDIFKLNIGPYDNFSFEYLGNFPFSTLNVDDIVNDSYLKLNKCLKYLLLI